MTLTLDIPSEIEASLREKAALRGQAVSDYLLTLAEADAWHEDSGEEEAVSAIREGLNDLDSGDRGMLLEEYRSEIMAKRGSHTERQGTKAA